MRRVLFLDIDGVLVNRNSLRLASGMSAKGDPPCVAELNRIIRETGCDICISSTWRLCGADMMQQHLDAWGVVGARVVGITPWLNEKRGVEIADWLNERFKRGMGYDRVAILDDDSDMVGLSRELIKTKFEVGLTAADADKVIKKLMRD